MITVFELYYNVLCLSYYFNTERCLHVFPLVSNLFIPLNAIYKVT